MGQRKRENKTKQTREKIKKKTKEKRTANASILSPLITKNRTVFTEKWVAILVIWCQ
jgi:hypothetical protein